MEAIATGSWVSRERVTRVAIISGVIGAAMLLFFWLARTGSVDFFGQPVGSDFTAFWNAGQLALSGDATSAWDHDALNASVTATHGTPYETAWLYPPVFLLITALFASLPYLPALLVWQASSLGAIGVTLHATLKSKRATLVALASPLTPMVLGHGQNSFVTGGLLGGGLLLLKRKPALAGGLFGALVYKPQLALVIAPLLILTRNWRALIAAGLSAAAWIALSVVAWGMESWNAFATALATGRTYMEQGSVGFFKSASLFSMARQWGAGVDASYAVQLAGTLLALSLIWRSIRSSSNVRAAAVCAGAALSTPYLLDYDMVVVGVGAAFLYAETRKAGFLPYELSALAFIWAAPWFSRPAAEYLTLPLGPIAMLLLAWMAWRRMRQSIAMPPLTCNVCPVT